MGCIQSSEEIESSGMGAITTIGRTERMIHRSTTTSTTNVKNGAQSKSKSKSKSTTDLKKQLQQSIRDRTNGSIKGPDIDVTGRLMPGEVASRRELSVEPKSTTIMDGDITIEYAFCSQRGYYPDGKFCSHRLF